MRHPLSLITLIASLCVALSCQATPDAAERSNAMDRDLMDVTTTKQR